MYIIFTYHHWYTCISPCFHQKSCNPWATEHQLNSISRERLISHLDWIGWNSCRHLRQPPSPYQLEGYDMIWYNMIWCDKMSNCLCYVSETVIVTPRMQWIQCRKYNITHLIPLFKIWLTKSFSADFSDLRQVASLAVTVVLRGQEFKVTAKLRTSSKEARSLVIEKETYLNI